MMWSFLALPLIVTKENKPIYNRKRINVPVCRAREVLVVINWKPADN